MDQLDVFRDQGLERIKRLVHRPSHGPQQNDPKIGIVEREIVVAGNRDENFASAHFLCPHDWPLFAVQIFDLRRTIQCFVCYGRASWRSYEGSDTCRVTSQMPIPLVRQIKLCRKALENGRL